MPQITEKNSVYAPQRQVDALRDCYFYHTTELPGFGLIKGEWDLRPGVEAYLGRENFKDQRFAIYLVPQLNFLPDPQKLAPLDTWWNLSPELISRWLKMLGFSRQRLSYHQQIHHYGEQLEHTRKRALFTIVAKRES